MMLIDDHTRHESSSSFSRFRRSAISRPEVKDRSGDEEPGSAHDEWRNCLDSVSDREVGRAPDHVDRGERSDYLRA